MTLLDAPVPTPAVPAPAGPDPRWSWPRSVAAHLLPGVLLTAFSALVAPHLTAAGLPAVWGLLGGVLLVVLPVEGGALWWHRRRERTRGRPVPPLLPRGDLPRRRLVPVGVAVAVASLLLSGVVLPLEPLLRSPLDRLAGAAPTPGDLVALPAWVRVVTLVLWFVAAVVVGPLVEEAWFRGVLQPRLPVGGTPGAVVGSVLFAAYHLWQPHAVVTVVATTLPIALLVARTRAVAVGAGVHVALNLVVFAGLAAGILVR